MSYSVHNLNGISWFLVEEVVGSISNSITSSADMIHIMKIARVLTSLGGELRNGRNLTTTGAHKVKDAAAKGNCLLQVANQIENATPNTPHSLPSIGIGHDIMNPMLYPESLEVVAKAFQQGSLGKENMSQLVDFLHLLGGDLLDITTWRCNRLYLIVAWVWAPYSGLSPQPSNLG